MNKLKELLELRTTTYKEDLLAYINKNQTNYNTAIELCLVDDQPYSWRTAWMLSHATTKNDSRLKKKLLDIIKAIPNKVDGQQRELLKVVMKMQPLNEEQEGYFFDVCMQLWEDVNKQPAVRFYAGCCIIDTAYKYPEIKNELEYLFGEYYTKTLSPGIKRSFDKRLRKLN